MSQEIAIASRSWQMEGKDSPLKSPEQTSPTSILILASSDSLTCDLQNWKTVSLCCFKPLRL